MFFAFILGSFNHFLEQDLDILVPTFVFFCSFNLKKTSTPNFTVKSPEKSVTISFQRLQVTIFEEILEN